MINPLQSSIPRNLMNSLGDLFRYLPRYPKTSLVQCAPRCSHVVAASNVVPVTTPAQKMKKVLMSWTFVAWRWGLHKSAGWSATQEHLTWLLPDLTVEQTIKKWVYCERRIRQPCDRSFGFFRGTTGESQRQMQVEGKVRQPAEQELTHDDG